MSMTRDRATDAPTTMAAMVLDAAARRRGMAVRHKEDSAWRRMGYAELGRNVTALARGLLALGVEPGDRVAILSQTRPEWTYADFAVLCVGGVVAPVYQTNSSEECRYVLEHSGARVLFCEDAVQLEKVEAIRGHLPALEHVVAFTQAREGALSLEALEARGEGIDEARVRERADAVSLDDLATIVYTSGTTGPPKGCMLTHGSLRADMDMVHQRISFPDDAVFYVFLPLAHALTRIVEFLAVDVGAELAYWQRDPKKLVEDVGEIEPTHLPSVPRLFEKIYTAATARVAEAGGAKEKLFHWAVGVGRRVREAEQAGREPGRVLQAQHALADRLVLHKVRDLFGGRIQLALTGAAPIDPEILQFFRAAGVYVLEGYGMTETAAVASLNTIEEHRFGTVGKPLPGCEVRIADDGEVLMKGPNVFSGYFNDEEATRSTLIDGWLYSGDLGELDADGYLKITGRKKDLIITSSGKNIAPSNIENLVRQTRWVSQVVVFGDRRPYLTALVTLDPDEAGALAEKVGAPGAGVATLARHEGARAEIQRVIDEANAQFANIEQIKRFEILERDLSQEDDELTPTLKVKRNVVYARHADVFSGLYD
ncbi:MAG: long-chain fatty acid--CoA ligase [Actinomycetota bacterium]|nr:long-chain fatty acid--CoA ligase [Actinomycetota bacterium]